MTVDDNRHLHVFVVAVAACCVDDRGGTMDDLCVEVVALVPPRGGGGGPLARGAIALPMDHIVREASEPT
jgi:hypothetical protein